MLDKELLPNFLIVGAAKAATTTIHEYLKQHPDIFMTENKEPCFLSFADKSQISFNVKGKTIRFITDINEYQKLFLNGKTNKIKGESSTPYLYFHKQTISNIKKIIPDHENMKILIMLRNPVDRAFSQYMMKVRNTVEDKTFMEALIHEPERMRQNEHFDFFYFDRGLYYNQVKSYLSEFKNVKVVLYEDFFNNSQNVLKEILTFLELNNSFQFKPIKNQNVSGRPKIKFIFKMIRNRPLLLRNLVKLIIPKHKRLKYINAVRRLNVKKEAIDSDAKKYLINKYTKDVKLLEELINKDLSNWLK